MQRWDDDGAALLPPSFGRGPDLGVERGNSRGGAPGAHKTRRSVILQVQVVGLSLYAVSRYSSDTAQRIKVYKKGGFEKGF